MRLTLDLTSDYICPWCYIGERRLAQAIEALDGEIQVDVRYRPFELNPDMPPEGRERAAYRIAKFGSLAASQEKDAHVAATGAADGLVFNFGRITRTPSTMRAHRLNWLAAQSGLDQTALARRLFAAYFTEAQDISDPAILRPIAAESGFTPDQTASILEGTAGAAEVRAMTDEAYRRGIQGVPMFEAGGYALSGAHPAAALEDAIRQIAALQQAA